MRFGLRNIIQGLGHSVSTQPKEVSSVIAPLSGTIAVSVKAELDELREDLLIGRKQKSTQLVDIGKRFEEFIGRVLKLCANQVVGEGIEVDHGWDYALWDSNLSGTAGGPITVEVKTSIRNRSIEAATLGQMRKAMLTTKTRISLVIYLDGPANGHVTEFPVEGITILFIPADILVSQLETSDLATFISNFKKIHKGKDDA